MLDPTLVKFSPNVNIKLGNQRRVGIVNKGKDTKIIDCEFENLDTAIQNEGENMVAEGNKIK